MSEQEATNSQQTAKSTDRLQLLELTARQSSGVSFQLKRGRRGALAIDASALPTDWALEDLICWTLYGDEDKSAGMNRPEGCEIVLQGRQRITINRKASGKASLGIDDGPVIWGVGSPGQAIFGVGADEFRSSAFHDARFAMLRGSQSELQRHLRDVCHVAEAEALAQRKSLKRKRLHLTPNNGDVALPDVCDPPALSGLMDAIADERTMVKGLLDRRIEGSKRLRELKRTPAQSPIAPQVAGELEENARRLNSMNTIQEKLNHQAGASGGAFLARGLLVVTAALGVGAALTGRALSDAMLLSFSWWSLGAFSLITLGTVIHRIGMSRRQTRLTAEVKRQRIRLEDATRRLALRIGEVLPGGALKTETIHEAIDRAMLRIKEADVSKMLDSISESPQAIDAITQLRIELEADPLQNSVRMPQAGAPAIDALSYNARQLVSDWANALQATHRNLISHCTERAQIELERDIIETSIRRLDKQLSSSTLDAPSLCSAKQLSETWNRSALVGLQKVLGELAPLRFNANLTAKFKITPSSETLSTTARWLETTEQMRPAIWDDATFPLMISNIGTGLPDDLAQRLIEELLSLPASKRPCLIFRNSTAIDRLRNAGHKTWCLGFDRVESNADKSPVAIPAVGEPPLVGASRD